MPASASIIPSNRRRCVWFSASLGAAGVGGDNTTKSPAGAETEFVPTIICSRGAIFGGAEFVGAMSPPRAISIENKNTGNKILNRCRRKNSTMPFNL